MQIPDFILIDKTIEKFNYDPRLFKGRNDYTKKVVRKCFICHNIYDQQFINAIISFRENRKCKYCANKERSISNAANLSILMKEKIKLGILKPPMAGRNHTNETKLNLSKIRNGKSYEEFFGILKSDEIKLKISKSTSGEKNGFYGKNHSQETIEFIRENSRKNAKRGKDSNFFGKNYNKIMNGDEFIRKCISIHGEKYDYSRVQYKGLKHHIEIICKKHGIFSQKAFIHIDGCGCQKCNSSQGELKILSFLIENKLSFVQQFKFDNCKRVKPLPFDFFLPDINTCIEYDGEFHYLDMGFNDLQSSQENDRIKNEFCFTNGINLIRISYLNKDNINDILSKELPNENIYRPSNKT